MDISEDKAIAGLDLEPIKRKLMRGKPGLAWPSERVEAAESEYRRFLFLTKMFPHELMAPSVDVDRFWHHHIVDTAKYSRDCEAVFGYFLHRYPYLGIGDQQDEAARLHAGARMHELHREMFGQYDAMSSGAALTTSFAMAVQPTSTDMRGHRPTRNAHDPDEPDPDDDLLDQIRFVVTENQCYDRMAEPARQLMR
jgi:hypothetical protein